MTRFRRPFDSTLVDEIVSSQGELLASFLSRNSEDATQEALNRLADNQIPGEK